MKTILVWAGAGGLIFLLVGGMNALLPGFDHSDEMRTSQTLSDAQRQEASDLRRDKAAAQVCREQFGPQTSFSWTEAGVLVCVPRSYKK